MQMISYSSHLCLMTTLKLLKTKSAKLVSYIRSIASQPLAKIKFSEIFFPPQTLKEIRHSWWFPNVCWKGNVHLISFMTQPSLWPTLHSSFQPLVMTQGTIQLQRALMQGHVYFRKAKSQIFHHVRLSKGNIPLHH